MNNETLAILGPSGCGKSMTLKCIAGIENPDEGKIILNQKILFDSKKNINLPPQERNTGFLFQSYALFPNMTLYENIKIGIRDKNYNKKEIEYFINKFSLKGLESNYPHQLSGGQKQRVALARMIINKPNIFMLDEPFSAIDDFLKFELEEELLEIIRTKNIPTLFVSHDKNEVFRICDNIITMKDGKIIEQGDKSSIFNNPKTLYTASLVGFKNISPITHIKDSLFYVNDWNLNINIENINKNITHIGLNENNINLNYDTGNTFNFKVIDIIPNYDYKLLLLKHKKNQKKYIYMKVGNNNIININDIIKISLCSENINTFSNSNNI